jgi:hypothetical protein
VAAGHFGGKEFEGDEAMEARVLCFVHHTHTATTELLNDAVVGDGMPDEWVGIRHSGVILAPATPSRWLRPRASQRTDRICRAD